MTFTREEQEAIDACAVVRCDDEWCDGLCGLCRDPHVLLGVALAAVDAVRERKKFDREQRLAFLLDDE